MNSIEPNLAALAWFAGLWTVCCLGFLQIAGLYPLDRGAARLPWGLVFGNTALWLALAAGTVLFAWIELRITTIIIVGGILFLFTPALFQVLPQSARDSSGGLLATAALLGLALVVVAQVAGPAISGLF